MQRVTNTPELLDRPGLDPGQMADSFREVWGVNRYLGGLAALQRHLAPWLHRWDLSLLDVAGGTGDVAVALQRWGRRNGANIAATVVDNHPQVLDIARGRSGLQVVDGDARQLPFADEQFDVAVCNLALHHFEPADAARVLREMDRVTRLGWVVCDLERHALAYASARLLALVLWRNPITRHDGPLSVRRSYRPAEVADLIRSNGLTARIHRHLPFRWAAVCRRRP